MTLPSLLRALCVLSIAVCLGACASSSGAKKRVSGSVGLETKPSEKISMEASRHMYVRTTAYHHSEPGGRATAMGGRLREVHSAATDWSWLPAGTKFRIVETGEEYFVEDYGSALIGKQTIDLYKSTRGEMNAWGVRYVHIEILELGSYKVSMAVLLPRQKYEHVRAMVSGLKKKV